MVPRCLRKGSALERREKNERLLERKNYVDGDPGELISGAAVMESRVLDSMDRPPGTRG
jgi:hypothetical protein